MTKKEIRPLTLYRIAFISSISLFAISLTINILTIFVPNLFGKSTSIINFICFIISVGFIIGFIIFLMMAISQKRFIEQLKLENTYPLGHPTPFYNLAAFKSRASKMMKFHSLARRKQYITAFTAASLETSFNLFNNDEMTTLNYEISLSLSRIFEGSRGLLNKRYNIFGFNRGIFLVYSFSDSEEIVREIVNSVTREIYRIAEDKKLKIWVQPFFGVREIVPGDNLTGAIEDALVARSNGEANFESYTRFIKKDDSDDDKAIYVSEIENALKNNEFIPYYQPKFNVKEKKFVGCEVLARWLSPTRGLVSPAQFIDKAEQFGLLSAIDIYIFERALIDIKNNLRRGRRVLPVSCNFSLYEFFSHTFLDTIVGLMEKYQVPAQYIEIEITETTSQVNQFLSISVIKKLKDYGIRVLMDDYGVGYSQIQNLKNIPFDAIKIDKSFTDLMLTDEKTCSIIKFLIDLGHVNDLEVIIEGVEKKEQVDKLKKMHIDTIQGFYYSKALPTKEYEQFLVNNPFEERKIDE